MGKLLELEIGKKYNMLTIVKEIEPDYSKRNQMIRRVECICDCGNKLNTVLSRLKNNTTHSCGCLHQKNSSIRIKKLNTTHNSTNDLLYKTWCNIKTRCFNANRKEWENYGGRGITMYKPWINNYELFKEWIINNIGDRKEGYTIDRYPNNDGNYEPGNLRWADKLTQSRNRRKYKNARR